MSWKDQLVKLGSREPRLRPHIRRVLGACSRVAKTQKQEDEDEAENQAEENILNSIKAGHAGQVADAISQRIMEWISPGEDVHDRLQKIEKSTANDEVGSVIVEVIDRDILISVEKVGADETKGDERYKYSLDLKVYERSAADSEVDRSFSLDLDSDTEFKKIKENLGDLTEKFSERLV